MGELIFGGAYIRRFAVLYSIYITDFFCFFRFQYIFFCIIFFFNIYQPRKVLS